MKAPQVQSLVQSVILQVEGERARVRAMQQSRFNTAPIPGRIEFENIERRQGRSGGGWTVQAQVEGEEVSQMRSLFKDCPVHAATCLELTYQETPTARVFGRTTRTAVLKDDGGSAVIGRAVSISMDKATGAVEIQQGWP